jgi:hypothetical protein
MYQFLFLSLSGRLAHSNKLSQKKKIVGEVSDTAAAAPTPEVHEVHEGHFEIIN